MEVSVSMPLPGQDHPLLFEQVAWLAPKVWAVCEEKYILSLPGKETRILDFHPLA